MVRHIIKKGGDLLRSGILGITSVHIIKRGEVVYLSLRFLGIYLLNFLSRVRL